MAMNPSWGMGFRVYPHECTAKRSWPMPVHDTLSGADGIVVSKVKGCGM